jgi:two-component system, sporulation sensor kinase B
LNTFSNVPIELWIFLLLIIPMVLLINHSCLKIMKNHTSTEKKKINLTLLDVSEELNNVIKSVHSTANQQNFQINYYSTLDSRIFIKGNQNKFHQAFLNIVKNGLEASQNGTIEIAAHEMLSSILIVIEHNGQSMTKDQIKRLSKSLQIHNAIESMKGKIEVVTPQGKGTIFSVIIPKAGGLKPTTIY